MEVPLLDVVAATLKYVGDEALKEATKSYLCPLTPDMVRRRLMYSCCAGMS